jgi:hypothetical protein
VAIRYEYSSDCCNHFYIETRNNGESQLNTKCNVCAQGDYVLITQTEIETIPQPIQTSSEIVVSAKDKFLAAGFTLEEIDLLVQEMKTEENL